MRPLRPKPWVSQIGRPYAAVDYLIAGGLIELYRTTEYLQPGIASTNKIIVYSYEYTRTRPRFLMITTSSPDLGGRMGCRVQVHHLPIDTSSTRWRQVSAERSTRTYSLHFACMSTTLCFTRAVQ